MDLLPALQAYFSAERDLGYLFVAMGAAVLGLAAWVWRTQEGGFAWALVVPLALFAVGIGASGVFLAQRSQSQLTSFEERARTAPGALVQEEGARMARVNANWIRVKITWTVAIVVALGLILGVAQPWSKGLGIALLLIATLLMWVDVFAERRAGPYTEALTRASASP